MIPDDCRPDDCRDIRNDPNDSAKECAGPDGEPFIVEEAAIQQSCEHGSES
jgi:hypothetical protein